jgi:hypothetical protein
MFPARMPRPPFGGAVRYSHRHACGIFRLALPDPDTTRRTVFENRRTCWLRFGYGQPCTMAHSTCFEDCSPATGMNGIRLAF